MKIRPLHDRVIVKRVEEEKKSAGGIVIPTPPPRSPSRAKSSPWGRARKDDNGKLIRSMSRSRPGAVRQVLRADREGEGR